MEVFMKFFKCKHCGNVIAYADYQGVPVFCCGEEMSEMIPGEVEASTEKHVPVIEIEGNKVTVTVGTVLHPMTEKHMIKWIALETKQGNQRKELKDGVPKASFMLCENDKVVAAYDYCNLHGLWKAGV